jgi:hypothetical protein
MRVDVEWNANKGFVATAFELKHPIVALTLSGLKQRLQTLFPDATGIEFRLDRAGTAGAGRTAGEPEFGARRAPAGVGEIARFIVRITGEDFFASVNFRGDGTAIRADRAISFFGGEVDAGRARTRRSVQLAGRAFRRRVPAACGR